MSTERAAPQPGTPEYDAAMAAKVDDSATKAAAAASESLVPPPAPQDPPAEQEKKPEEPPKAAEEKAAEALESRGLDLAEFSDEFDEKGELSAESFEKLEKAGIPKTFVDAYIEGQKALANQLRSDAFTAVGGEQQYQTMLAWAQTALTKAEQDAFNKATRGSREEVMLAVNSLKGRFEGAYGRSPNLLGGSQQGTAPQGYASRQEMTAAMRDPRYSRDPAYRASVAAKLAVSEF